MKKLAILSAIALSGLIYNTANAQIRINFGLHIRPVYARYHAPVVVEEPVYQEPVQVYDDSNDDDYYYLPDVDAYYNVSAGCYYYNDGDNWVSAAYLPGAYRNYDWRSVRRYEVREHRPFARADFYRSRFNGRQVAEFRNYRHDNDSRGGYGHYNGYNRDNDNRHYNHDNDNRYYNHGGYNRPEQNRSNDNHYGNRGQGGYNQPSYPGRNQNNENHGQVGYGQPSQNNGGHQWGQGHSAQPNQNNGGSEEHGRGGNDHFAQNMGMSHRMARY
ncbi:MAG: hypothetical protein ABIN13_11360 [Mucilaginibacter sp.]